MVGTEKIKKWFNLTMYLDHLKIQPQITWVHNKEEHQTPLC